MSVPDPGTPPPLPPPLPEGARASPEPEPESRHDLPDRLQVVPAPLFWRSLAYMFDWLLVTLVIIIFFRWMLPQYHSEELSALRTWATGLWESYRTLYTHPQADYSRFMEQARAIPDKARAIPEAAAKLLEFIATVQTFFFWGYFFVTEFFTGGASFGKKIFHLRVASTSDRGPPRFFDSLMRSAWKSIFCCSSSPLLLLIGVVDAHVPLFNPRRRSWHDMLSHTEVIDARSDLWVAPRKTRADDEDSFFH